MYNSLIVRDLLREFLYSIAMKGYIIIRCVSVFIRFFSIVAIFIHMTRYLYGCSEKKWEKEASHTRFFRSPIAISDYYRSYCSVNLLHSFFRLFRQLTDCHSYDYELDVLIQCME